MVQSGAGWHPYTKASWHGASEPEQRKERIHVVGLPGKGNRSPNKVRKVGICEWVAHCWLSEPREHEMGKKGIQRRVA